MGASAFEADHRRTVPQDSNPPCILVEIVQKDFNFKHVVVSSLVVPWSEVVE
jgi:hypothetical protein